MTGVQTCALPICFPVTIGYEEIEALIEFFLDGDDKISLISSDLSHYYDEKTANELDGYCINAVEKLNMDALAKCEACGIVGIAAATLYAIKHNLKSKTLDYRTSAKAEITLSVAVMAALVSKESPVNATLLTVAAKSEIVLEVCVPVWLALFMSAE